MDKTILKDMKSWGQISDRELVLEEIRERHYKNFPSRMACLYVSTTLDDAKKWAKYFSDCGRKVYQIVELKCRGNSFTGDAKNCWYESDSKEDSILKAKDYWDNKANNKNKEAIYETIIDGEITVVDIIEDYSFE